MTNFLARKGRMGDSSATYFLRAMTHAELGEMIMDAIGDSAVNCIDCVGADYYRVSAYHIDKNNKRTLIGTFRDTDYTFTAQHSDSTLYEQRFRASMCRVFGDNYCELLGALTKNKKS